MGITKDETPLKREYLPENIINRDNERQKLEMALNQVQNTHIHGPHGTGKTHLVKKALNSVDANTCYLSGLNYDTQYKSLRKIHLELTGESIGTGHHTSELQRQIQKRTGARDTLIALDDLDFLLLNDGDDLLYFLSRLDNSIGLILITANHRDLKEQVEPRTYSSLQTQRVNFEPYTGKQIYEILSDRASKSLEPRTVHRSALTYIASSTQNAEYALTWLQTTINQSEDTVTENLVQKYQENAYQLYVENQLTPLTQQHKIVYQAISELSGETGPLINTGKIYKRYQTITEERNQEPLSDRRISDYLKQLELLDLISAEYHYGGKKGKTRDIQLTRLQ